MGPKLLLVIGTDLRGSPTPRPRVWDPLGGLRGSMLGRGEGSMSLACFVSASEVGQWMSWIGARAWQWAGSGEGQTKRGQPEGQPQSRTRT
jgi:hypothetical protein